MTHSEPTDDTEAGNSCDSESLTGYALVESLMRRQDEALAELDVLNQRVEDAIAEITASRASSDEESKQDSAPAETQEIRTERRAA